MTGHFAICKRTCQLAVGSRVTHKAVVVLNKNSVLYYEIPKRYTCDEKRKHSFQAPDESTPIFGSRRRLQILLAISYVVTKEYRREKRA